MNTLLLHCRPGFEGEACAEISEYAAALQVTGFARGKPASSLLKFAYGLSDFAV